MVKRMLILLWLIILLRITVFRDGCFSHGLFSGRIEWDAFAYYAELARKGNWRYFTYLFVGNLIWFVPAGIFVRLRGGSLWQAALAGFCLSLFVETCQFVLGSGVSELDDLVLNTCGAVLGFGLTDLFFRLRAKKIIQFPIDKKPQDTDNRRSINPYILRNDKKVLEEKKWQKKLNAAPKSPSRK